MITTNLNTQISATPSLLTIQEYEQNITENPQEVTNYWYLGLALLLAGREEEAQIAWMTPLLEFGEEESEQWLQQLTEILFNAAQQQETDSQCQLAWVIRQHIREFVPGDINNLLKIIELNIDLKIEDWETTINQLIAIISELIEPSIFDEKLLVQVIEKLLRPNPVNPPALIDKLVEAFIPYLINSATIIQLLIDKADSYYFCFNLGMSIYFCKIGFRLEPDSLYFTVKIITNLQLLGGDYYQESIDWANKYLAASPEPIKQIHGTHYLLAAFLESLENPEKALQTYQKYKQLLCDLVSSETESKSLLTNTLLAFGHFFLYMEDNPHENRLIRNRLATLCQKMIWKEFPEKISIYQQRLNTPRPALSARPLRIGYVSECFRSHSVGYLAWWLLKYHNRQEFDIHLYSLRENIYDRQQQAYQNEFGDHFHQLCPPIVTIADKINEDEIDILVDLDSLTSYSNCFILALKTAPIQVSWLGYDATGFPTVDYFIADNYVLPASAQDYYTEKIWRLPQNYIGIDGFTVGTPTISRESLDIPNDGIIYFSSQTGLKRNPDNIRLQMQIIKQVPNSYFLLKSFRSNHEDMQNFIAPLAEAEGLDLECFRFLPTAPTEMEHRANLAIADIVLDTYPYNGATTTLETLWMGVPIVTKVGEQFAARNSYTMMMNVGVTEGLAWSDEEYVEWGVKLGKDEKLRQEIVWKLRKSRQTSPLWNGQKFAREMENAYQQMWQKYIDSKK
jgi:predicted O-linked N-acetylglucosamine transferase (SPINDLY family)